MINPQEKKAPKETVENLMACAPTTHTGGNFANNGEASVGKNLLSFYLGVLLILILRDSYFSAPVST